MDRRVARKKTLRDDIKRKGGGREEEKRYSSDRLSSTQSILKGEAYGSTRPKEEGEKLPGMRGEELQSKNFRSRKKRTERVREG